MKFLWDELRPYLACLAAFSLIMNVLFLVPALFMLQVFDRVLPSRSWETLLVLLAGTAVALALLFSLDYVRNRLQAALGSIVDERLSPRVVRAVVAKAASTPHAARTGAVRDVAALRAAFSSSALVAVFDAPWVVVYVGVIWVFFHPALGASAGLAGTLMLALAWANDRASRGALEGLQRETRRTSQYVEGSLRNAEVLQALGMTGMLLRRWDALQRRVAALHARATRRGTAFSAGTRCARQAVQIAMLSLGAYLVLTEHASPGVMIATTIILGRALQPIEQLVASWRTLGDARAAHARLAEVAKDFEAGPKGLEIPRPAGRLSVEALAYRAPGTEKLILAGVSFALAPGEVLALIGASAAGKSTLARLLIGIWAPSVGAVRLDGADVARWPREELGRWVGYVPQDVELFDGTVAENIARLGELEPEAVVAAARRAGAHELILSLPQGYDTPVGEHGARLSPGQRQRVALARALYGDPRLVVLDEPNANLDGEGELALAKAVKRLREDQITTVVITHRPSLTQHADKVLVLEGGRVQRFGPAAEVMKALASRPPVAPPLNPRGATAPARA